MLTMSTKYRNRIAVKKTVVHKVEKEKYVVGSEALYATA